MDSPGQVLPSDWALGSLYSWPVSHVPNELRRHTVVIAMKESEPRMVALTCKSSTLGNRGKTCFLLLTQYHTMVLL